MSDNSTINGFFRLLANESHAYAMLMHILMTRAPMGHRRQRKSTDKEKVSYTCEKDWTYGGLYVVMVCVILGLVMR